MDRAYGGVSLILHVEGANRPNSPLRPEYVKADVYFPGYLFNEDVRFPPFISHITQQFITEIGLPVIERWERCALAQWTLTQGQGKPLPAPYREQDERPNATPNGSSSFVIHGRKRKVVVVDSAQADDGNASDDSYAELRVEPLPLELELFDALERNAYLEDDIKSIRQELAETKKALSDALAREYTLSAKLETAMAQLSVLVEGASGSQPLHQLTVTPSRRHPLASASPRAPPSPSHRNLTYTSPIRRTMTPRTPTNCSGSSHLQTTPHFWDGAVSPSRSSESFADYHEFLNFYGISHMTSSLEYIRNNIPLLSWSEHMEKMEIPSEQIGSLVSLLLKAGSANSSSQ